MQKFRVEKSVVISVPQTTLLFRSAFDKSTFQEWVRGPLTGFLQVGSEVIGDVIPSVFTARYDVYNCWCLKLVCFMAYPPPPVYHSRNHFIRVPTILEYMHYIQIDGNQAPTSKS